MSKLGGRLHITNSGMSKLGGRLLEIEISLLTKSGPQDSGGHIQLTNMIDTQQYIKLNIHGEVSIIVVQAHSGRKRDICT
jgi:hypothetical protein